MSGKPKTLRVSVADSSKGDKLSTMRPWVLSTGTACLAPGFSTVSTDFELIFGPEVNARVRSVEECPQQHHGADLTDARRCIDTRNNAPI